KRYPTLFCLADVMIYVNHNRHECKLHHNVGLRHVSNALIPCRLHRNMPKAYPYAMAFFHRRFGNSA
ncbi:MAG: hypothetical protein MR928_07800, partial [Bacteroidales bacterium]|nr:hypothetical protein [Bacteroidales bacterium]